MKVTLINPDYMMYADPPVGLAYLAGYIKKVHPDIKIEILDQLTLKQILSSLKKNKPDIIGLGATCLNYYKVKTLGKILAKEVPDSLLVIGGVYITTMPESFKDSPFDIGLLGESEKNFSELIKNIKKNQGVNLKELRKIKGFLLRDKKKVINTGMPELIENLDDIPLPERDLLDMKFYTLPAILSTDLDSMGALLTSRGCPYNCAFCSSACIWQRKLRFFSAQRVADEIEILYKKYGYRNIVIYDDLFSVNKPRLKKIIELLDKKRILRKIKFFALARANTFDEETAQLLKKLNILELTFGFESGSQRMLNYLKGKHIKLKDSIRAINLCKKYKISCYGLFMIGSPTEKIEDLEKTYNFIKKYCPNFTIYQTIALPGTRVWDYAIKNKIIKKDYYEHKQKDFIDVDTKYLLSKDIPPETFKKYFKKINSLEISKSRQGVFKKILRLRPRHMVKILSLTFIKKAYILRKQFLKRVV